MYAAHCGTAVGEVRFGPSAVAPARVVKTDRCRGFPGAKLGDGTDLAYCVLEEPVVDVEPERILAGCELDAFGAGEPAIIVGYGLDGDGGEYGTQRFATSSIERIDDELFLETGTTDTCRGDSGGPVFVERVEPDGSVQRRVAGVTSAGTESECGRGIGHYVNLTRKLEWLEQSSQLDVTPCFDGETWSPTPRCHVATCGDLFDRSPDEQPPFVALASPVEHDVEFPLAEGASFVEFELAADAVDDGWGVEHVAISLSSADGERLFHRIDEIAPYGLPALRVPPGRFTLEVEAVDFAGNASTRSVTLQVGDVPSPERWSLGGGACASSPYGPRSGASGALLAALGMALVRRRFRRASASGSS